MIANINRFEKSDGSLWVGSDGQGEVTIHAPIDMTHSLAVAELFRAFVDAANRPWTARVVVDLTMVEHMDTTLLAMLIACQRMSLNTDSGLEVRLSPTVRQWMGVCRIQWLHD